ncbi:MAG TPA: bifunctional hydroxymethylpyrimidine kinase/phosphomethylpyrimidine kinase [Candidatus Dormibacteraeota bacterium]|nr:bifunctional hydroxymethylpyrimidine kinase/phosphomethylpyrimidine kinase [Candidatus Dormibacteraeota bacterium]
MSVAIACTMAGSDSGGGAGIQADLKTFAACGVYGCSAIVALTAQNTLGVRAVQVADLDVIAAQIDAVAEDLPPNAWKTGMLASEEVIEVVVDRLSAHHVNHLVVDPVMISKSGAALLEPEAIAALRRLLLPLAEVVTPNLPEIRALSGIEVLTAEHARDSARAIAEMGPRIVVVKGGHAGSDPVIDLIHDRDTDSWRKLSYPRIPGTSTHGTGCTLSAAIAAHLARGQAPMDAIDAARAYLQVALQRAPGLGAGHGPLGHLPLEG